ncbi:hypothetical protein GCM10011519_10930 [Marmoricola endophyticus]|uniref:Uncharacterized protein n=1 Tax=Marmoricola endophyticus TaxID=2040280 RepID=A0A917BGR2_9ACTN|nr:hypothetical protein [Marmoricola endophyticus]GGF39115.1 hypothetical protein GCM10011519_10930 [Marmoricola endophyticus]
MAKALLGHTGAADPRVTARLAADNRLLRQRVADLEAYVLRLQAENDQLAAAARADDEALLPL